MVIWSESRIELNRDDQRGSINYNFRYQIIAHQRDVPVLDSFYQQILNLLWPR